MARINIDIEDYLDEVNTEILISELSKRSVKKTSYLSEIDLSEIDLKDLLFELQERKSNLDIFRLILGLKKWHGKTEIIKEIEAL
jgi:hypothetical protein